MDKGQILRDYKAAKNHKRQIPILADLNACSKETIIEILAEGGYLRIFNTNGVDVSTKSDEITEKYHNGESVAALAKTYHVSLKGMKTILGIEETEEKEPMANDANVAELEKKIDVLTKENEILQKTADEAKACAAKLQKRIEELEKDKDSNSFIYDKYQDQCIKINQLNTTIDVLVDRISMLKAVRGHE